MNGVSADRNGEQYLLVVNAELADLREWKGYLQSHTNR